MVGIISNDGLGLFDSSMDRLGTSHGNPTSLGQAKGSANVNIATGNLSVQFLDESLSGSAADMFALRTYNSQGTFAGSVHDGDNDGWRWSAEKRIVMENGLPTVVWGDAGDSKFKLIAPDKYQSTDGSGAHDILEWNASTSEWKLTEDGGSIEHYFKGSTGWIDRTLDTTGTGVGFKYEFSNNKITSVTDLITGQCLKFEYGGNGKLAELKTFSKANATDAGALLKQVSYTYYATGEVGEGMLKTATTDLFTPVNASYTTTYTYFGDKKIKGISQSDGTSAEFTYDGSGRVATVTDQTGVTTFTYNTNSTAVKNALNETWTYAYDATSKQLKTVSSSFGAHNSYDYDPNNGDVKTVTNGTGNTVTYSYEDGRGNRTKEVDTLGNTITRTFGLKNELLTETRYSVASTTTPGGAETTRYIYDTSNRLKFVVTQEGRVTENNYNTTLGLLTSVRQYAAKSFDLTAIPAPTLANLANWVAALTSAEKQKQQLTTFEYDYRGNLQKKTAFADVSSSGAGLLNNAADVTQYSYDEYGRLLHTITSRTTSDKFTAYTYDGMGRQLSVINSAGTTTTVYSGVNITVTNEASGLKTVSTTDNRGRITSLKQSLIDNSNSRTTKYYYDKAGQLRMTEDPTGARNYLFYDAAGRVSARVDATGAVTAYTYNRNNQVLTETRYTNAIAAATISTWFDNTKPEDEKIVKASLVINVAGTAGLDIATDTTNDRKTTYSYYESGLLKTTTVDGTSAIVNTYDGTSRLIKTVQSGRITKYYYDKDGRQRGVLNAERNFTEMVYDSAGRLIQTIRYDGQVTTTSQALEVAQDPETFNKVKADVAANTTLSSYFFYDGEGRPVGVVNEQGFLTETVYDAVNNQRKTIQYKTPVAVLSDSTLSGLKSDAGASNTTTIQFDKFGREETVTTQDGTISRNVYDAAGRLSISIQAEGTSDHRASAIRYNAFGEITNSVSGTGLTTTSTQTEINTAISTSGTTYEIDGAGRKVAVLGPAEAGKPQTKTFLFYNSAGQLTYTVNALGEVSKTTYNSFGQVSEVRVYTERLSSANLATITTGGLDSNISSKVVASGTDKIVATTYNKLGLVYTQTDAEGYVTTNTYNNYGLLYDSTRTIVSGSSAVTTRGLFGYDLLGRLRDSYADYDGLRARTTVNYDGLGRVWQTLDANRRATTTNYTDNGRTIEIVDPLGRNTKAEIDFAGRTLNTTDANGYVTAYVYDDSNRKITVTSPNGVQIITWKTRTGETLQIQDGNGKKTVYTYTKDGQLDQVINALGEITDNAYDNSGRLYESKDANGVITRYSYDAANRIVQKAVDPAGLNIRTKYEFDGQGRQIFVTEGFGTTEATKTKYVYNKNGQIAQIVVDPDTLKLSTKFTYDGLGNTVRVDKGTESDQLQQSTIYNFNKLGRKTSEVIEMGSGSPNIVTTYDYDSNGNLTRKTDPNGNYTSYVYDAANQLRFTINAEGAVTENIYDSNGNVTSTIQYDKLVNPATVYTESSIDAALASWSNGFSSSAAGYTLPATNYSVANGQLVMSSVKTAVGSTAEFPQTWGSARAVGTSFYYEIITDGAANQHYGTVGINSTDRKRRHAVQQNGGSFYVEYVDGSGVVKNQLLGAIKENTKYIIEIDSDSNGTTLYLYESGKARSTGYTDRRNYSDWKDVATWLLVANSPALASNTTISVDAVREFLPSNSRKTFYAYNKDNQLRFTVNAEGAVTETIYDKNGNVIRKNEFAVIPNLLGVYTEANIDALVDKAHVDNRTTSYVYDAANRLRFTINAEGAVTENVYDANGNVTSTIQYDKLVNPATVYTENTIDAVLATWSNGFSTSASGFTLPPTNFSVANGQLLISTTKTASGTPSTYPQAWGTTRAVGTSFYYEIITDGATNQHYGSVGINSTDWKRRHVVNQNGDSFYVEYVDASGTAQTQLLGGIKSNTKYIIEIESDGEGTTLYLYESGKSRASGFTDRRNYSDWKDVASWMLAGNAPHMLANTTIYVDAVREYLPSNARVTNYTYDKANRQTKTTLAGWYDVTDGRVYANKEAQSDRFQRTVEVTYDALGNAVANKVRVGLSDYVYQYKTFDKAGREVNDIDALGYVTQKTYYTTGELKSVTRSANPLGTVPGRGYWLNTEIATQTGRTIDYQYDKAGRKTKVTQASTGTNFKSAGVYIAAAVTDYQYDGLGNLIKQSSNIDNTGTKAETYFYYDVLGRRKWMVQVGEDSAGLAYFGTETTYDVFGGIKNVTEYYNKGTDTLGSTTTRPNYAPDTENGQLRDRVTEYTYDKLGRVKTTKRRVNQESALTLIDTKSYNNFGEVVESIDVLGNVTTMQYNRMGRLASLTEPARDVAAIASNSHPNTLDVFNFQMTGARPVTTYTYNTFGENIKETRVTDTGRGLELTTQYVRDLAGNKIQTQDVNGYWSNNAYNSNGKIIRQTQAVSVSNATTDMNYAHNIETRYEYDKVGRQIATMDVYGTSQSGQINKYNGYGEVEVEYKVWEITGAYGGPINTAQSLMGNNENSAIVSEYLYDEAGRVKRKRSSEGYTYFYYDLNGKITRTEQRGITDATSGARITENIYDRLGYLKAQKLPQYEVITAFASTNTEMRTPIIKQTFDRWGNVLSREDAATKITNYKYNQDNKLISETGPATSMINYDGSPKDTSLEHRMVYDKGGRLFQDSYIAWITAPSGIAYGSVHTTTNEYNNIGQLIKTFDPTGVKQEFAYDANGNRVGTKSAAGHVTLYDYNAKGQVINQSILRVNDLGKIKEYTGSEGGILTAVSLASYQYDQAGRKYAEADGADNKQYYRFDERGNIVRERSRAGLVKIYKYDELGHKTHEVQVVGATEEELNFWSYKYGADFKNYAVDQLQSRKVANDNNLTYDYTYSRFGQLEKETLRVDTNRIVAYTYWSNGLLASINESKSESIAAGTYNTAYTRNDWNKITYYYDVKGNKTGEHVNQEFHQTSYTQTVPAQGGGQEYKPPIDKVGNLKTFYEYDDLNRITKVNSPAGNLFRNDASMSSIFIDYIKYDYDEWGNRRRISANYGGGSTKEEWFSYDAAGRVKVEGGVIVNNQIVASSKQGIVYTYNNITGLRESQETFKGGAVAYRATSGGGSPYMFPPPDHLFAIDFGVTSFLYDDLGRVKQRGESINRREKILKEANLSEGYIFPYSYSDTSMPLQNYSVTQAELDDPDNQWGITKYHLTLETTEYDSRGFVSVIKRENIDSLYGLDESKDEKDTISQYDDDGRMLLQITRFLNNPFIINGQRIPRMESSSQYQYNLDGSLKQFEYKSYKENGTDLFKNTYVYEYVDTFSGSQIKKIEVTSNQEGTQEGTTTNNYDFRGRLILADKIEQHHLDTPDIYFNYNASGQIIARVKGNAIFTYYYSPTGGELAKKEGWGLEVSPLSAFQEGGGTLDSYKINKGDTLMGIAQTLFGDSKLWYLISDANGLTMSPTEFFPDTDEGRSLRIPNIDKSISNTSSNWKPYNSAEIIGDLTPSVIIPRPPKQKCEALIFFVSAIITIIVTAITKDPAIGAAAGNYAGQYLTLMANGQYDWKKLLRPDAQFKGNRDDILKQIIDPLAVGAEKKIDYTSVAISYGASRIAQGVAGSGGGFWNGVAQGATTYVANYALNRAAGYDVTFSAGGMAAQGLAQGFGNAMGGGGAETTTTNYDFSAFDWGQMVESTMVSLRNGVVSSALSGILDPKHSNLNFNAMVGSALAQGVMGGFVVQPKPVKEPETPNEQKEINDKLVKPTEDMGKSATDARDQAQLEKIRLETGTPSMLTHEDEIFNNAMERMVNDENLYRYGEEAFWDEADAVMQSVNDTLDSMANHSSMDMGADMDIGSGYSLSSPENLRYLRRPTGSGIKSMDYLLMVDDTLREMGFGYNSTTTNMTPQDLKLDRLLKMSAGLEIGSSGDAVIALQKELGFTGEDLDGKLGRGTNTALQNRISGLREVGENTKLLADPEIQAFLKVLRIKESSNRYDVVYGSKVRITDFSDHPRGVKIDGSNASGAYQFLSSTWDPIAKRLDLPDFSVQSQDLAAISLLRKIGAITQLKTGNLDAAIFKAGSQWDAFPINAKGAGIGDKIHKPMVRPLEPIKEMYYLELGKLNAKK